MSKLTSTDSISRSTMPSPSATARIRAASSQVRGADHLVKAIPFYGFHVGYRFYLKIYMFNPIVMTRLADLQQGMVMGRRFQPYEAHLQYLLQFMIDYNLYGCSYIESSED